MYLYSQCNLLLVDIYAGKVINGGMSEEIVLQRKFRFMGDGSSLSVRREIKCPERNVLDRSWADGQ